MMEVAVPGLVDYYVVKNDKGEYLDAQCQWTTDPYQVWKYESEVAWHDAREYGGTVYAVCGDGE